MRIGIAGAGGIGSNVAMLLVRAGFTKFTIVDFDYLEQSNLNRQFYFEDQLGKSKVESLKINLERINKNVDLKIVNVKLEKSNVHKIFKDCTIIVEAFDKKEYKSMIIEECLNNTKMIVSASGVGGMELFNIQTKVMMKKLYIVGDFNTDVSEYKTYSTKVTYISAIMANIIIQNFENKLKK